MSQPARLLRDNTGRGEIVKGARVGGVMAGVLGVRKIIKHGIQAEIVKVWEGILRAGVPEMTAGEVIKVCAACAIVGVNKIFEAQVEVIKVREECVSVITEKVAIGEGQVIDAVAETDKESVTCRVKLNVPLVIGVPDMTPLVAKSNPGGNAPEMFVQL